MSFASVSWAQVAPIGLLLVSNVFMTFAWYGHLKFTDKPLWLVVVVSWGIACRVMLRGAGQPRPTPPPAPPS